jgi:hypothetical protein
MLMTQVKTTSEIRDSMTTFKMAGHAINLYELPGIVTSWSQQRNTV